MNPFADPVVAIISTSILFDLEMYEVMFNLLPQRDTLTLAPTLELAFALTMKLHPYANRTVGEVLVVEWSLLNMHELLAPYAFLIR